MSFAAFRFFVPMFLLCAFRFFSLTPSVSFSHFFKFYFIFGVEVPQKTLFSFISPICFPPASVSLALTLRRVFACFSCFLFFFGLVSPLRFALRCFPALARQVVADPFPASPPHFLPRRSFSALWLLRVTPFQTQALISFLSLSVNHFLRLCFVFAVSSLLLCRLRVLPCFVPQLSVGCGGCLARFLSQAKNALTCRPRPHLRALLRACAHLAPCRRPRGWLAKPGCLTLVAVSASTAARQGIRLRQPTLQRPGPPGTARPAGGGKVNGGLRFRTAAGASRPAPRGGVDRGSVAQRPARASAHGPALRLSSLSPLAAAERSRRLSPHR
ncbi:hypothetical protein TvY486_0002160 [Trypanosoma vivax Y486]|uniref:Transmembrane protein n=1 Tax=Trypanosoma vivax (strain Y486) TaxID=1055687 RepID=F9WPU3_TRYVY|nr:hypothetical protein TvY486_0002160 [Trypanosoma vivax Y486]|eukprot:CCD19570.1 hypothetical protein TvY486_0002160 [Trypanosoma vivax Y486]